MRYLDQQLHGYLRVVTGADTFSMCRVRSALNCPLPVESDGKEEEEEGGGSLKARSKPNIRLPLQATQARYEK